MVFYFHHFDNPVDLFDYRFNDASVDIGGKKNVGKSGLFYRVNVNPFDVDFAFGQKSGDPVKHSRLVFDFDIYCV